MDLSVECFDFNQSHHCNLSTDHYFRLSRVSQQLSKSDLDELLFTCSDVLSESTIEKITTARELFQKLKHLGCISQGKYDFLRARLLIIGRNDLACQLPDEIEALFRDAHSHGSPFGGIPTIVHSGLSKVVESAIYTTTGTTEKAGKDSSRVDVSNHLILLQIADHLTSTEIENIAYICSSPKGPLSTSILSEKQKISVIELFWQLEQKQIIGPNNYSFLMRCLHNIGRKDLVELLVSLLKPQALMDCLQATHQNLKMKLHMLTAKHSTFAGQMKTLKTLTKGEPSLMLKLVNPFLRQLITSYSYRNVLPMAKELTQSSQRTFTDFESVVTSSLLSVFNYMRPYLAGLRIVRDSAQINFNQLAKTFGQCEACFQEFDKCVAPLLWNTVIRDKVHQELKYRRTPVGTPAKMACSIIRELSQELFGGEAIQREYKQIDEELLTLESCHYTFCYRILMYQWLMTLLCLASPQPSSASDSKPIIDMTRHKDTLLEIFHLHKQDITAVWQIVSEIVGQSISQKLLSFLNDAGIEIVVPAATQAPLDFFQRMSVGLYTFLMLLSALAFLGPNCFELEEVSKQLTQYQQGFLSSSAHVSSSIQITVKAAGAFQSKVELFRTKALEMDQLCAPLLHQLTAIDP